MRITQTDTNPHLTHMQPKRYFPTKTETKNQRTYKIQVFITNNHGKIMFDKWAKRIHKGSAFSASSFRISSCDRVCGKSLGKAYAFFFGVLPVGWSSCFVSQTNIDNISMHISMCETQTTTTQTKIKKNIETYHDSGLDVLVRDGTKRFRFLIQLIGKCVGAVVDLRGLGIDVGTVCLGLLLQLRQMGVHGCLAFARRCN